MTDKEIIIDDLSCNNCPEKKRCDEQRKRKNNMIDIQLQDIKDTAQAYHCDLSSEIEKLRQTLPNITRCDVVLQKQLQRKEQLLKQDQHYFKELTKYIEETANLLGIDTRQSLLGKNSIEFYGVLSCTINNKINELKAENDAQSSLVDFYLQKIEVLQTEDEKLKKKISTYKKMLDDPEVRVALIDVRTGERDIWRNLGDKAYRYKQALEKIYNICKAILADELHHQEGSIITAKNMLDIINEVNN